MAESSKLHSSKEESTMSDSRTCSPPIEKEEMDKIVTQFMKEMRENGEKHGLKDAIESKLTELKKLPKNSPPEVSCVTLMEAANLVEEENRKGAFASFFKSDETCKTSMAQDGRIVMEQAIKVLRTQAKLIEDSVTPKKNIKDDSLKKLQALAKKDTSSFKFPKDWFFSAQFKSKVASLLDVLLLFGDDTDFTAQVKNQVHIEVLKLAKAIADQQQQNDWFEKEKGEELPASIPASIPVSYMTGVGLINPVNQGKMNSPSSPSGVGMIKPVENSSAKVAAKYVPGVGIVRMDNPVGPSSVAVKPA
eukprot:TRINITY_DN25426_c0_g1_i1.p1 TRINITY_DN25426_c0_g1~~TRINITY_DN25426_c0_g1_i1.p1  ORF type:complete len:357 (+),score=65.56 TRINITY_DN25426_c0_g1_i1:159-1073(+)